MAKLFHFLSRLVLSACLILGLAAPASAAMVRVLTVQGGISPAMIPRGEVGLIFAQLGLNQGILDAETYAALLIVIALTTIAPPFLLKAYYGRHANAAS